jgi:hypothetical protein
MVRVIRACTFKIAASLSRRGRQGAEVQMLTYRSESLNRLDLDLVFIEKLGGGPKLWRLYMATLRVTPMQVCVHFSEALRISNDIMLPLLLE